MPTISLDAAQKINFSLPLPDLGCSQSSIYKAVGEILAEEVFCQKSLPAFDNSAMDGYALKICDLNKEIFVKNTILAGQNAQGVEIRQGECVKVMTGAMLPKGTQVVVPFENTQTINDSCIMALGGFKAGDNIRLKGEEKEIGFQIANIGDKLTPAKLALLASQGKSEVNIYKGLKIGVYSTGNEIVEPNESAQEHQIYNINAVAIISILRAYGHYGEYLGILEDDLSKHQQAISGFKNFDVIITSGGASVGEADLLEKSLLNFGAKIAYHGINLKPGRPIMLATLEKQAVFALPGNPLSAMVNLISIVMPALERLRGARAFYPKPMLCELKDALQLKSDRVNIVLGNSQNGEFKPYRGGKYGSNPISAVDDCNSIAFFGEKTSEGLGLIKTLPYVMEFSDTMGTFIN